MSIFAVFKSSPDGFASVTDLTLEEVPGEVWNPKGWDTLEDLRARVLDWAADAQPGQTFHTSISVIVCTDIERPNPETIGKCRDCGDEVDLTYGEFSPVESGNIEQDAWCSKCGRQHKDVFRLAERRELTRKII